MLNVPRGTEYGVAAPANHSELENALKQFRMKLSQEQNVKPFYIFTNKTLEELIQKQPCSVDELKTIHGIGEKKINAFGEELVGIIRNHKQKAGS